MVRHSQRQGDTIIEVLLALTIFSLVAFGSILIMNNSVSLTQQSLEVNLVRNQINNQADLLRHFNAAYLAASGRVGVSDAEIMNSDPDSPAAQWIKITNTLAEDYTPNFPDMVDSNDPLKCRPPKPGEPVTPIAAFNNNVFFINPVTGAIMNNKTADFESPGTFAKIRSDPAAPLGTKSEMIWINADHKATSDRHALTGDSRNPSSRKLSDYYDFHIQSCWSAPKGDQVMTLGTIVRLYVPKS